MTSDSRPTDRKVASPMPPRFWTAPPLMAGICELPETEAHHVRSVLRLSAGATVELFDGAGRSGTACLTVVDKRRVCAEVADVVEQPASRQTLILACAVPKGDRFDWLIEKATELGVHTLVPLRTERSSVDPRETKLERLRQLVVAACKQSRRNDLLRIAPVCDWPTFLQSLPTQQPLLVANPGGLPLQQWLIAHGPPAAHAPVTLHAAIGPEGGWTDAELRAADAAGAVRVSLGPHILRIETAAVAVAALLLPWGE